MAPFAPVSLITTDLHLSDKEEDAYRFGLFDWISTNYADKIQAVFILGDLSDRKNYHADLFVDRVVTSIRKLARHFHVFLLKGNHDYDADPDTPYFGFLGRFANITHISKPTLWTGSLTTATRPRWRILFLPHTREPGKDWDLRSHKKLDVVMMHQTFRGAVVSEPVHSVGLLM